MPSMWDSFKRHCWSAYVSSSLGGRGRAQTSDLVSGILLHELPLLSGGFFFSTHPDSPLTINISHPKSSSPDSA